MTEISPGKKRFVKRMLREESPAIRIGKGGISEEVIMEIERQLKKNRMVKIKILKTGLTEDSPKRAATEVASRTKSSIVEVRGHTFMLYRRTKQ